MNERRMIPLTNKERATKALAVQAIKDEALRGGVTVRRVTQLFWSPSTGEVSGLGHGTDADGERFKFWVDAKLPGWAR